MLIAEKPTTCASSGDGKQAAKSVGLLFVVDAVVIR